MRQFWILACLLWTLAGGQPRPSVSDRFYQAVAKHEQTALKSVLASGFPVNTRLDNGNLPLGWVVFMGGNEGEIDALLSSGAKLDLHDQWGRTPLMAAAGWHMPECVRHLLAKGARVSETDPHGRTAMHYAVGWAYGDFVGGDYEGATLEVIRALHAAGLDWDTPDKRGQTPLMLAAGFRHPPALTALIAGGARVERTDSSGRTALTWASSHWRPKDDECIRILLNAGAEMKLMDALEQGDLQLAEKCLTRGDGVNVRGTRGETPLARAAELADPDLVRRLIKAGVDLNALDDEGATALHLACAGRPQQWMPSGTVTWPDMSAPAARLAIVRELLAAGAKPNVAVRGGQTSLIWAARASTVEIVTALIAGGANLNAVANKQFGGQENALQIMLDMDARAKDPEQLAKALVLLKAGLDPAKPRTKGALGRYLREFDKSDEIVELLLSKGLSVSEPDEYGWTPLMAAVENPRLVKRLLALGAPVNAKHVSKLTALMCAAISGSAESVKLLLKAGAEKAAKNYDGKTAYDFAVLNHHPDIANLIGPN